MPVQRLERDADVKQIAARVIMPVQVASWFDIAREEVQRLSGDVLI